MRRSLVHGPHVMQSSPRAGSPGSRRRRLTAAFAVVVLVMGGVVAVPRLAEAQESYAFVAVPKYKSWSFALRPGERLTLSDVVDFVPKFPGRSTVLLATAVADGGVRLNDTTVVTRGTLAQLLATVVTATADGTVTVIVDANVNLSGTVVTTRTSVVLTIKSIASRIRLSPTASPFRATAGTTYRLRDLMTYEKLDPLALMQNYGFEVTGGVVCVDPSARPVTCRPVSKDISQVFTEGLLNERFAATASGRLTVVLYVVGPGSGDPFERFSIDVEVTGSAPAPTIPAPSGAAPGAFVIVPLSPLPAVTGDEAIPLGKFINVTPIWAFPQIVSIAFQTSAGAQLNGASKGTIAPSLEALLASTVTASSDGGISIFIQVLALQPGQVAPALNLSVGAVSVRFVAPTGVNAAAAPPTPNAAAVVASGPTTTRGATKSATKVAARTTKKTIKKTTKKR